ncbi:TPA: AAA family ATPase, partial [Staphylococcus aureus]|nr:AAA family ATPase [Staphylococcus aureus]HDH6112314.1 AAA family ATPase [Staphylococcus aureus]HDH6760266.1 AAA family ATPase [Staphylococcus aureus]
GDVYLNSESIFENSTLKKEIFYTPVNPFFYENLSAKDNLYLICSLYNRKIDQITIEKTIKDVGLNIEDLNIPVYNFSSGMKQKLNFASMLLVDSNVLLLDEPFNALDHVAQKNFTRILKGLVSKEKIIIFTSHLPNTILELSENIYLLKDGCFTDKRKAQSFNQTTLETWLLESQKEVIPYEEK